MTNGNQIGKEVATILAGSWRPSPCSKLQVSAETLTRLAPLLTVSGAGALTWFRIRALDCNLDPHIVGLYRNSYLYSSARGAAHEAALGRLINALNDCAIRSILLKGWSTGRLYPESALRPSGDIDLWIDPEQRGRAGAVIRDLGLKQAVDLEHDQLRRFENRGFDEFYESCETANLGSSSMKVLRREDQIRILCLHFLKHGGWRPVWLCDIAVFLESEHTSFDWNLCLGPHRMRARWIGATIALAQDLLGARIPERAPPDVTTSPPPWLPQTVLREWSDPRPQSVPSLSVLLPSLVRRPLRIKAAMRGRWKNAIQATVDCNGAFNAMPRWLYQAKNAAIRAVHFRP